MSTVTLRRVPVANEAPDLGTFTVFYDQYDTVGRRVFRDAMQASNNTGPNAPFELTPPNPGTSTPGQLVPGASYCLGTTLREVRYAGSGDIYTQDVANAPACASTLDNLSVIAAPVSKIDQFDGTLTAYWSGGIAPFTVRVGMLAPGRADVPPFAYTTSVSGPPVLLPPPVSALTNLVDGRTRRRGGGTLQTSGLGPGRYRVEVTEDLTGYTLTFDVVLGVTSYAVAGRVVLNDNDSHSELAFASLDPSHILLYLAIRRDATDLMQTWAVTYDPAAHAVVANVGTLTFYTFLTTVTTPLPTYFPIYAVADLEYYLPAGELLDYVGTNQVISDGQGGIHIRPNAPVPRAMRVDNLVLVHPDRPGDNTAGILVEVDAQLDADVSALFFTLKTSGGTTVASNTSGNFDSLPAGEYTVEVVSVLPRWAPVSVSVTLKARYGLRWYLDFDDIKETLCRLELWTQGYEGEPEEIWGQGDPVIRDAQGLESGALQEDLGHSIGTSLEIKLLAEPGQLQDLVLQDRACRADLYYAGHLKFRGYVQPDIYTEALFDGLIPVSMTATCGLAGLADIDFAGHVGQELRGRRPMLNTLIHCLSRCDVALPLGIYTSFKPLELATAETPEGRLFTDRLAYLTDKGEPLDGRAVLNALCQALRGTLVQREGNWEIRSINEAEGTVTGRRYLPAGTPLVSRTLPAPAHTIKPPTLAQADTEDLFWLDENQFQQRRAGWKSLSAKADAGFAKNAFRQGQYFTAGFMWNRAGTAMSAAAGWKAGGIGPGPASFPMKLVEATTKAGELRTTLPFASGSNNYLESEPAPLRAGREGLPMRVSMTAKFITLRANSTPAMAEVGATVLVEIISDNPGDSPFSSGHVFEFKVDVTGKAGYTTLTADVPFGLPAFARFPRVRIHPYKIHNFIARARTRVDEPFELLVESVGLELLPQGAEADGESTFTAHGPGGTVRPQSPIEVFHLDAPPDSGFFAGTPHAFRRTITRGVDGPTTQWARASDLQPAPLLAAAVLDSLALRGNPSRLLQGTVQHLATTLVDQPVTVPEALDAIDAPYDVDGRRWIIANARWNVKQATHELAMPEIGVGQFLTIPVYDNLNGLVLLEGIVHDPATGDYFNQYLLGEDGAPILYEA